MAFATNQVIAAYSPYHKITSEYGPHSSEGSEAAEEAIQRILSASETKTALSYILAINIAVQTGNGSPEILLHEGYHGLSNSELMRFLGNTRRYWDESENERINSVITVENESSDFPISTIPFLEIEPKFRDALRSCFDTLQNRILGHTVNFYLDLYLDRKDCSSRT